MKTVIGIAIITIAVGIMFVHADSTVTWGSLQSGTVIAVSSYPHGQVYSVTMGKSTGMITTIGSCNIKVGDTIFYKVSSVNATIGTQMMQIVHPENCKTGISGFWN